MKGKLIIEISSNEALELLSSEDTPASVIKKITSALRGNTKVTPIGRRAGALAKKAPAAKEPSND